MMREFAGLSATILVVDDEPDILDLLSEGLSPHFSRVLVAQDPRHALKIVSEQSISLLLTDYRMPRMDGRQLMAEVKKVRPLLPVLFITGNGADQEVLKVLELGAADVIEKPFRLPIVVNRIRTSLLQPMMLDLLWSMMSREMPESSLEKFMILPVEQQVRQLFAYGALVKTKALKKAV